jgi:adenylyltransferase/sulfurtransferase
MKTVNVQELKQLIDEKQDFQLIDVREPFENDLCTLNGVLIPMAEILARLDEINTDKKVIIHCRSGMRSANVISYLEQNHSYSNLFNLTGGILAWSAEIDPSMPSY